ncbi:hypothetical protein C8Q79DRAFT_991373 [Trametes meyenii]|nr:hypothetical protein C8Q79DRAFT_991373 [Trametes meyenii]
MLNSKRAGRSSKPSVDYRSDAYFPSIHRLPVELLLDVFALAEPPTLPTSAISSGWVKLMLVCRHWRAVIVEASQFWSNIDFASHPDWIRLCLSRSKASIHVRIVVISSELVKVATSILTPRAGQIRTLVVTDYCGGDFLTMLLYTLMFAQMPALKQLTITNSLNLDPFRPERQSGIDLGLSADRLPRLCALSLENVILPPSPQFYRLLTSLRLHGKCFPRQDATLEYLLRILRATSAQLQELSLSRIRMADLDATAQVLHPPASVDLPNLREFHMDHNNIVASRLLQLLNIPSTCTSFYLHTNTVSSPGDPTEESSRAVLLRLLPQPVRSLIENASELMLSVNLTTYSIKEPSRSRSQPATPAGPWLPEDRIYIYIRDLDWSHPPQPEDIVFAVSLAQLTSLTITSHLEGPLEDAVWKTLFRACPHLDSLAVSESSAHETMVFHVLMVSTAGSLSPPCHALRVLSVKTYALSARVGEVVKCLRSRAPHTRKLEHLSLGSQVPFKGGLGDSDIHALRPFVQKLVIL